MSDYSNASLRKRTLRRIEHSSSKFVMLLIIFPRDIDKEIEDLTALGYSTVVVTPSPTRLTPIDMFLQHLPGLHKTPLLLLLGLPDGH